MLLEGMDHAGGHEIHNRLRCVDDPVRIGQACRVPLEKLLIDRIEKVLLIREIR